MSWLSRVTQKKYVPPSVEDTDVATNVEWNRQRWGQSAGWRERDQFGYQWGGGHQQTVGEIAALADDFFRPHTNGRYDLRIVELAPGGGRFTAELVRYASRMCVADLNESALKICRKRFAYIPTPIDYVVTDGKSFDAVPTDIKWDAVACFDSMVHMHPDVVRQYVHGMAKVLVTGGFAWLDHSGRGSRNEGHRTAMTAELMQEIAAESGFEMIAQPFRNEWDCISVLRFMG
jgi:SAM-dependent methyltransferase